MQLDRWDSYRYVPDMREALEITTTEYRALLEGETLVMDPKDIRKFGAEITIEDGPFIIIPDPDYVPLKSNKVFDMATQAVLRHGEHSGQAGVEGQQGGSAPGFTHGEGSGEISDFDSPVDPFSEESAEDWLEKSFDPVVNLLDEDEIGALARYKVTDFQQINSQLRGSFVPESLRDEARANIDRIDGVMEGSKTPEDIIAYRGMDTGDQKIGGMQPGDTFFLDAYTSTTLHVQPIRDFMDTSDVEGDQPMVMQIRIPKGTSAIYMDSDRIRTSINIEFNERELLLDRGLTYQVVATGDSVIAGMRERAIIVEVVP